MWVWFVGIGLVEHDAEDFVFYPPVAHRFIPGLAELCGSMKPICSALLVEFVIAEAWVERYVAQLSCQVLFCQLIVLRRSCVYNVASLDTKGGRAFIAPKCAHG